MRSAIWGATLAAVISHSAMGQDSLPDVARGIAVPADKGYAVEQIGEGLYFVTDGFYTTMFMTTGMGTIVVDAPPSLGDKMLRAIRDVTNEPIRWIVYSHSHADHIGAAGMYPKDATYIAQKETLARLRRTNDSGRVAPYGVFVGGQAVPLPTVAFDDEYELKVGSQSLTLSYRGNNHEPGNIYIYAPRQRVLMLVDIIFPGWTPFKDLAIAEDVTGYIKAHDVILSFPFDRMVTGHWNRYATRSDVEAQRDYIHDIERNAVTALKSVDFYGVAGRIGTQNLARLFDTYLNEVAQKCADATAQNWKARLAGIDVWTFSHCQQIVNALRVD
jgi:glyoxylase-like metal-dependent hydrolase (beta-lactamase superfamily II)